jgi:peptidyl-prolyl cis-trans isomerase C
MHMSRILLLALVALLVSLVSHACDAKTATASHILVKSELLAVNLAEQLAEGDVDFEALAKEHSTCPSKKRGGSLGTFPPGT